MGMVVDVEKDVIQVCNGPRMEVEVLPLNMVNMLHVLEKFENGVKNRHEEWLTKEMEQMQLKTWANILQLSNLDGLHDESFFDDNMMEFESVSDDPQRVLQHLERQIEELTNQGMDCIVDEEALMHMFNLVLQQQHQNVLNEQLIEDDDYSNWIKCADVNKDARMQQKMGEIVKPNVHLYHVQVDDELIIEGDKWDQNFKNQVR